MAWFAPWRREPALTASALRLDSEIRSESVRRRHEDWQDRAIDYCDLVPEAYYASLFYARAFPKIELIAGELVETDEGIEAKPTQNANAIATLDRIQDPGGGRQKLLAQYGRLMFATGECYLLGQEKDGVEQWETLSHSELRIKADSDNAYERLEAPGLRPEQIRALPDDAWRPVEGDAIVARLWRPHMKYSWWADSPMRAVLDTCEELLLLTQAIHARATSRAAGPGILVVAQSVANSVDTVEPESADEAQMTPLMRVLARGLTTPIGNPGHASAVVPILLTAPDELVEKAVHHVSLYDTMAEWPEAALREKAVERFARGADFPPEYLTGIADTNHWNAWQVDEQTWAAHIQPVVELFVGDMTAALYRPMLEADGMGADEASRFVVMYDESEVVTRADKSVSAKDGWDRGIVSGEAYMREAGFDTETDAMDEDEYRKWVGFQLKDANLALGGDVTPPPPPPQFPPPQGDQQPPPDQPPPESPPPEPAPADQSPNGSTSQTARILGAAELAVTMARERAGNRLWSKAAKCPECRDAARNVPRSLVAATLGPDAFPDTPPPGVLVQGASEVFLQTLIGWGVPLEQATYLADAVHRHAARTLYDAEPVGLPGELVGYAEAV